jgi:hypothetical protein
MLLAVSVLASGCAVGVTGSATDVEGTSATIEGTVFSTIGGPTSYWVKYGATASYGRRTAKASIDLQANVAENVAVALTNLDPDRLYHYRLCAQDGSAGSLCGEDRTFETGRADFVRGLLYLPIVSRSAPQYRFTASSGPLGESPKGATFYTCCGYPIYTFGNVTCLNVRDSRATVGSQVFVSDGMFGDPPRVTGPSGVFYEVEDNGEADVDRLNVRDAPTSEPTVCPDPPADLTSANSTEGIQGNLIVHDDAGGSP